jgi:hypothetical protein
MIKRRPFITGLLTLPLIARFVKAGDESAETQPSFSVGEKLTYSLGWQFIVAGHATLEVLPDEEWEGRKIRSFQMTAKTNKVADKLFKVRDSLSSLAEYDVSRSLGYSKRQREGDTKRDVSVDFDWDNLTANYYEAIGGHRETTPVLENTLDPLSAFYFIRNQKLDIGTIIEGPMSDGKRCKMTKIEVVQRKTIKVNGRKYDAFKLIPDIQDIGGVFEKSKDAKMEIWCTADHRHIPVLLKSKVVVGSFKAELETKI